MLITISNYEFICCKFLWPFILRKLSFCTQWKSLFGNAITYDSEFVRHFASKCAYILIVYICHDKMCISKVQWFLLQNPIQLRIDSAVIFELPVLFRLLIVSKNRSCQKNFSYRDSSENCLLLSCLGLLETCSSVLHVVYICHIDKMCVSKVQWFSLQNRGQKFRTCARS